MSESQHDRRVPTSREEKRVTVRLNGAKLDQVDDLIRSGLVSNRSDAIRLLIDEGYSAVTIEQEEAERQE